MTVTAGRDGVLLALGALGGAVCMAIGFGLGLVAVDLDGDAQRVRGAVRRDLERVERVGAGSDQHPQLGGAGLPAAAAATPRGSASSAADLAR